MKISDRIKDSDNKGNVTSTSYSMNDFNYFEISNGEDFDYIEPKSNVYYEAVELDENNNFQKSNQKSLLSEIENDLLDNNGINEKSAEKTKNHQDQNLSDKNLEEKKMISVLNSVEDNNIDEIQKKKNNEDKSLFLKEEIMENQAETINGRTKNNRKFNILKKSLIEKITEDEQSESEPNSRENLEKIFKKKKEKIIFAYKCDLCSFKTDSKPGLAQHQTKMHLRSNEKTKNEIKINDKVISKDVEEKEIDSKSIKKIMSDSVLTLKEVIYDQEKQLDLNMKNRIKEKDEFLTQLPEKNGKIKQAQAELDAKSRELDHLRVQFEDYRRSNIQSASSLIEVLIERDFLKNQLDLEKYKKSELERIQKSLNSSLNECRLENINLQAQLNQVLGQILIWKSNQFIMK
ncbi:unnamed protein product [Brachionus calyciflorus]|uniref:Uncharacterized protein n=1 Tax=Brachionus calyciflorus TaxID=104777 RepID=A0A814GH72_9BILA|nr:unnamed protein product [Brachionus calyciflorus]